MNKVIIEYTSCTDCQYCQHNGMFQSHPKWVCHNPQVSKDKKRIPDVKYSYISPILGSINKEFVPIPDWCPLLREDKYECDK